MADLRDLFVTYKAVKAPEAKEIDIATPNFASTIDTSPEEEEEEEEEEDKPFIVPKEMPKEKEKENEIRSYTYEPGKLQEKFEEICRDQGIPIRVTSGNRNAGEAGSAGVSSLHCQGKAIDISWERNADGSLIKDLDELKETLLNNPTIMKFLEDNDLSILDETSEEVLKKTHGTGAHLHIGADKSIKADFNIDKLYNAIRNMDTSPIDKNKSKDEWNESDKKNWAQAMFAAYVKAMKKDSEFKGKKSDKNIYKLAYYMTMQSAIESGWGGNQNARLNNNYGGHLKNAQEGELVNYRSLADYAAAQVRTLKKWNVKDATSLNDFVKKLYDNKNNLKYNATDNEQTYLNKISGCSQRLKDYIGFSLKEGGQIVKLEKYAMLRKINNLNIWRR